MPNGDPIIIDDGGSTRIKQLIVNTQGILDGLLTSPHQDVADGQFPDGAGSGGTNAKCYVRIISIDKNGVVTKLPAAPNDPNFELSGGDTAEIVSGLNQSLKITLNSGGGILVDLNGTNGDPVVEARQNGAQRRYIVSNSGLILQVKTRNAVRFNSQPDGAYTQVRLSATP